MLRGRRTLVLSASAALALAGCGSSGSSSSSEPSIPTATANPAAEAGAQRRAEAIWERKGIDFYVGELRASTVRVSRPCKPAEAGEEGKSLPGEWECVAWGLVSLVGGDEARPGQCRVVTGKVKATGIVGKPEGEVETFKGSLCQLDFGLGRPGRKPKAGLVAGWDRKQKAEIAHVKAEEESPAGREAQAERNQEEAEEAKRTREAEAVE
jgi:hypothetical protein